MKLRAVNVPKTDLFHLPRKCEMDDEELMFAIVHGEYYEPEENAKKYHADLKHVRLSLSHGKFKILGIFTWSRVCCQWAEADEIVNIIQAKQTPK